MKHPPYHLRPNKAIDRLLLVDLLRHIMTKDAASQYRYVGFGGPFLEDMRIVGQAFPGIRMISLEKNQQTLLRQRRHLSSKRTQLVRQDFKSYLNSDFPVDEPVVVWLDYTDLKYSHFDDLENLLPRLCDNSIVKVTVAADPFHWLVRVSPDVDATVRNRLEEESITRFNNEFKAILDPTISATDELISDFPSLVQRMFHISTQRALPATMGTVFQMLCSSTYSDQTPMYSITGVICNRGSVNQVRRKARRWRFSNTTWAEPKVIDVPDLSIKERLFLEPHLPCSSKSGAGIQRILGYQIESGREKSLRKMKNFQDFHSLYPFFSKLDF